jgi:hypothetical protein
MMLCRTDKLRRFSLSVFVLVLAVSFLIAQGGVVLAGSNCCGSKTTGQMEKSSPVHKCCCCGNGEKQAGQDEQCSGLKGKCWSAGDSGATVSISNNESPIFYIPPTFAHESELTFRKMDVPGSISGHPIIYFTNLNLLC